MPDATPIEMSDNGQTLTFIGRGELDLSNAGELKEVLKATSDVERELVIDLRQVTFIDSAVLAYIARTGGAQLDRHRSLKVMVAAGSQPLKVLQVLRFDRLAEVIIEPAS